ncbi:type III secretion system translocon subunit SctB [Noviherbaspirillum sp. CPCC 100848]|uniref:Type III secretion system translocon subunit SctB n=1 Tax=Noviherbaspirillum album TaxID=3080276 RepID=A0ABU6JBV0_9BURK|nr:type III secretion system translocon subunit SctB [Noviherbaspirillum sp. CPCC 100848]MEC4720732.1 type III secretion system translocon subunit SctB [Noviherbaspirillum sp. CPCC 100848]
MSNSIQNNGSAGVGYISGASLGDVAGTASAEKSAGAKQPTNIDATQFQSIASLLGQGGSLDIAPPATGLTIGNQERALAELNSLSSNVSADLQDFMAVFLKLAQEMRSSQREVRQSEMQAQVTTLFNAADKMREAAGLRYAAAVADGITQIAAGAVMAGGAAKSATGGQHLYGIGEGMSKSISGLGGIVSSSIKLGADMADAKRSELEATAKTHENASQQANDMMQQMQDIIRDIREKLQAINQASIEANRGIARNI